MRARFTKPGLAYLALALAAVGGVLYATIQIYTAGGKELPETFSACVGHSAATLGMFAIIGAGDMFFRFEESKELQEERRKREEESRQARIASDARLDRALAVAEEERDYYRALREQEREEERARWEREQALREQEREEERVRWEREQAMREREQSMREQELARQAQEREDERARQAQEREQERAQREQEIARQAQEREDERARQAQEREQERAQERVQHQQVISIAEQNRQLLADLMAQNLEMNHRLLNILEHRNGNGASEAV